MLERPVFANEFVVQFALLGTEDRGLPCSDLLLYQFLPYERAEQNIDAQVTQDVLRDIEDLEVAVVDKGIGKQSRAVCI